MKWLLIIIGIVAFAFLLFSVIMVVALAWCHHPEGIIKAYKNRRKQNGKQR
jgi:hypothetical protein